jgi:hypothetical protein
MTDLVPIGQGFFLAPAPAAAWLRAAAAGCPQTITNAYRSEALQQSMRDTYLRQVAAGLHPTYVAPVSKSEHVTGYALDLKDPAIAWMRAHPDYGFVFTDATERWHVAYRFAMDRHLLPIVTNLPTITVGEGSKDNNDMINDIVELSTRVLGRALSTDEILSRLGQTPSEVAKDFLNAPVTNEPYSIDVAYREYLGREPDPAGKATWLKAGTVRQARDGIRASKEAKARGW